MKRQQIQACESCTYWRDKDRKPEQYRFMFGMFIFDVEQAKRLVGDLELLWFKVEDLQPALQYVNIEQVHVDHVDHETPIIVCDTFGNLRKAGSQLVIDGHHRIARAIKLGKELMQGYRIPGNLAKRICIETQPRR